LIIDDDRAIAQLTRIVMQSAGYAADIAYDGCSGIALAKSSHPDVIILDLRMPDLDGFEVADILRADPEVANVPIVFLSANVQEHVRQNVLAVGASAFLSKPFEADDLLAATKAALADSSPQPHGVDSNDDTEQIQANPDR